MKLPSQIKFYDLKTRRAFEELADSKHEDEKIYSWLINAFEDIEENSFCGIQIPKRLIPQEYSKNKKINNLWKYNLPEGWRLLYSIENQEVIVVAIILEWMDHKNYEKRFRY